MHFKYTKYEDSGVVVIDSPERLEGKTSILFRKMIINTAETESKKIVVNMMHTRFIDSNGISSLVAKISDTREHNGDIRLASINKLVHSILSITNLDKIFRMYPSAEEAVKSFKE